MDDIVGDAVHAVIVIAILRELSLGDIVDDKPLLIPHGPYLRISDCREGISNNGQSCTSQDHHGVPSAVFRSSTCHACSG